MGTKGAVVKDVQFVHRLSSDLFRVAGFLCAVMSHMHLIFNLKTTPIHIVSQNFPHPIGSGIYDLFIFLTFVTLGGNRPQAFAKKVCTTLQNKCNLLQFHDPPVASGTFKHCRSLPFLPRFCRLGCLLLDEKANAWCKNGATVKTIQSGKQQQLLRHRFPSVIRHR